MPDTETLKKCSICGELKPLTEFHVSRQTKCGRVASCKVCANASNRIRLRKRRKKYGKRASVGNRYIDTAYRQINRTIVAKQLCLYRKRFKVLKDAGVKIDLHQKATEAELIANNNLIDRTLEAAGLGDKRVDRWEKLQ